MHYKLQITEENRVVIIAFNNGEGPVPVERLLPLSLNVFPGCSESPLTFAEINVWFWDLVLPSAKEMCAFLSEEVWQWMRKKWIRIELLTEDSPRVVFFHFLTLCLSSLGDVSEMSPSFAQEDTPYLNMVVPAGSKYSFWSLIRSLSEMSDQVPWLQPVTKEHGEGSPGRGCSETQPVSLCPWVSPLVVHYQMLSFLQQVHMLWWQGTATVQVD